MNSLKIFLMLSNLFLATFFYAQHQDVFPDLIGDDLLDALEENYKADIAFTYGQARDTMFANVDSHNDSLTCVYTGYTIYLDPTLDPTQAAFQNDGPDAINTEHTYPQGLGATGDARSDMHHLYPTRKDVNGVRHDFPFMEIPDNQTNSWWFLDDNQTNIPSQNIDNYSEFGNEVFEAREDHKGDVARSMFYFYTMYKNQADANDPNYFANQVETLCQWHYDDPVSDKEWSRTWKIAPYQEDLPNPFVLDCTLPERSYCSEFNLQCEPVSTGEVEKQGFYLKPNFPNPFQNKTQIQYNLTENFEVELSIFNALGQKIETIISEKQSQGEYSYNWERQANISSGIIYLQMILKNERGIFVENQKMILMP